MTEPILPPLKPILLDRQLRALEKAFLQAVGFTERLYYTPTQARGHWKAP